MAKKKAAAKKAAPKPKVNKKASAAKKKASRKKKGTVQLFSAALVDFPAASSWVLAQPGTPPTIPVVTSNWPTGDRVWAKIHPVTESPTPPVDPDTDLEGFTALNVNGTNREGSVPVDAGISCAIATPAANNIALTIVYIENSQLPPAILLTRVQFKYICGTFTASVPGYACPWFAFRQDDNGPTGEDIGIHRPVRVRIPTNAATVSITATGWWRHSPVINGVDSGGSGPGGRTGETTPLYQPLYRTESANDAPGRPLIELPNTPMPLVNTLVAVPDYPDSTVTSKILKLGAGPTNLTNPSQYKSLHLGLWDGTQWNKANSPTEISNSGSVDVTFTWAP